MLSPVSSTLLLWCGFNPSGAPRAPRVFLFGAGAVIRRKRPELALPLLGQLQSPSARKAGAALSLSGAFAHNRGRPLFDACCRSQGRAGDWQSAALYWQRASAQSYVDASHCQVDHALCQVNASHWQVDGSLWHVDAALCHVDAAPWHVDAAPWHVDAALWQVNAPLCQSESALCQYQHVG